IDAICETPGIDAVWIGHADLSLSLGVPGDLESEAYRRAEDRIVESCRAHGMPWTIGVAPTPAVGLEQARRGAFTVFVDDEVGLITRTLAEYVAEFTSALATP